MYTDPNDMRYFPTFEQREEVFRERVFNLVPRRYAGPSQFWIDMSSTCIENLTKASEISLAYITSNPQDCLAFGTASQVIRAAILTAHTSNKNARIELDLICQKFELSNIINQPICTLSGGETVKLALAKTYIMSHYSNNLIISSPFSWLSPQNMHLLSYVIHKFQGNSKNIELLALAGEDNLEPDEKEASNDITKLPFLIHFRDIVIELQSFIDINPSNKRTATIADCEYDLFSPCLFEGDNGHGKSLTALILSRAISFKGDATVRSEGKIGLARLLLQDVLTQTLLRSFRRIVLSSKRSGELKTINIYNSIIKEFVNYFKSLNKGVPLIGYDENLGPKTLLETKIILIAVRLCTHPSALILDEPDWGLSKESSIALVVSVSKVAHSMGIPIIIISNKTWWEHIVKSKITARKKLISATNFQIELSLKSKEILFE